MTPEGRYLVTLPTLIEEVSIASTTQSCSKVLKSCKCSCGSQNFWICDLHLCNTLSHFWNYFFNQKFSSRVHGSFRLDHLQTMLTFLTMPWAANWRVIRCCRCDLAVPRNVNRWRHLHPVPKKRKKRTTSRPFFRGRNFEKKRRLRRLEHTGCLNSKNMFWTSGKIRCNFTCTLQKTRARHIRDTNEKTTLYFENKKPCSMSPISTFPTPGLCGRHVHGESNIHLCTMESGKIGATYPLSSKVQMVAACIGPLSKKSWGDKGQKW